MEKNLCINCKPAFGDRKIRRLFQSFINVGCFSEKREKFLIPIWGLNSFIQLSTFNAAVLTKSSKIIVTFRLHPVFTKETREVFLHCVRDKKEKKENIASKKRQWPESNIITWLGTYLPCVTQTCGNYVARTKHLGDLWKKKTSMNSFEFKWNTFRIKTNKHFNYRRCMGDFMSQYWWYSQRSLYFCPFPRAGFFDTQLILILSKRQKKPIRCHES